MGARTRNTYRAAAVAFCNWCIETGRLLSQSLRQSGEGRRRRRPASATSGADRSRITRLLDVARRRPLLDAHDDTTGASEQGEVVGSLREETRRRLERLGQERALIYKTLVLTGLRKGELASITVGQVVLDAATPYLCLNAADEKNREGSTIPLRADLAADLRRMACRQGNGLAGSRRQRAGGSIRLETPETAGTRPGRFYGAGGAILSAVDSADAAARYAAVHCADRAWCESLTGTWLPPALLVGWKCRRVTEIDKRDERGRTVDVHALRHTFGTLLSKGGVSPRTAQAAMRHSDVNLTMNTYTDPKLLDVAGAMEALPALPLGMGSKRSRRRKCNRDRRFDRFAACTNACTNHWQNEHIGVNSGQGGR